MAGKKIEIGPTGRTVGENIRAAREKKKQTQKDLEEALKVAARPISEAGVRAIENGQRRIDVDDLTTIAAILDVSPAALLKPTGDQALTGVPDGVTTDDLALWVTGQGRLESGDDVLEAKRKMKGLKVRIRELEARLANMSLRLNELDKHISACSSAGAVHGVETGLWQAEKNQILHERGFILLELKEAREDLIDLDMIYG